MLNMVNTGSLLQVGELLHAPHGKTIPLIPSYGVTNVVGLKGIALYGRAVSFDPTNASFFAFALNVNNAIGFIHAEISTSPCACSVTLFEGGMKFVARTEPASGITKGSYVTIDNGLFKSAVTGGLAMGQALEDGVDVQDYGVVYVAVLYSFVMI